MGRMFIESVLIPSQKNSNADTIKTVFLRRNGEMFLESVFIRHDERP